MTMKRRLLRTGLGMVLGGFAGLSLTLSILPMLVAWSGFTDSMLAMLAFRQFESLVSLLWAGGAGVVAWKGGAKFGGAALGVVGLATGYGLQSLAFGEAPFPILFLAAVGGGAYGVVGGVLLGSVFRPPE